MSEKRIDVVIGTRPEAIKMAPVILELRSRKEFKTRVIATGQHTDMLVQALNYFSITADENLGVMKERQSLDYITSSVMEGVGRLFDSDLPSAVLVHGDTTTTLAASIAAFYRKIPLGHVEAGLRSWNMQLPFPEEMNRVLTDKLARWLFAPTEGARANLIREGLDPESILVTGNTVVDALQAAMANGATEQANCLSSMPEDAPFLLFTAHRRESWGEPLVRICRAIKTVISRHPEYRVIVPMHKNPTVRETIKSILGDDERITLCDPLDYPDFVRAIDRCFLILSDSGGVQEEASALAKPLLILRDVTERPEAVERGSGFLVGTDEGRIIAAADELLSSPEAYRLARQRSERDAFGDGRARVRIADALLRDLA